MSRTTRLTEELRAGPARIRINVQGVPVRGHVLENIAFMDYRLAGLQITTGEPTLQQTDIVWEAAGEKAVGYQPDRSVVTFTDPWEEGPIQKMAVAVLALRLEERCWHPFHASAVRYRGRTVLLDEVDRVI